MAETLLVVDIVASDCLARLHLVWVSASLGLQALRRHQLHSVPLLQRIHAIDLRYFRPSLVAHRGLPDMHLSLLLSVPTKRLASSESAPAAAFFCRQGLEGAVMEH